jgi:hypothetical protein
MIDGLKVPEAWHAHYLFQLLEEDHIQVSCQFRSRASSVRLVKFKNDGVLEMFGCGPLLFKDRGFQFILRIRSS